MGFNVDMAEVPDHIANARVVAARVTGFSAVARDGSCPHDYTAIIIDVCGMACPLEVESSVFDVMLRAWRDRVGDYAVLRRSSPRHAWCLESFMDEQAATSRCLSAAAHAEQEQ
jgi:hypothetical protein